MRSRALIATAALALGVAACGGQATDNTVAPVQLAYSFAAGDSLIYEVTVDQHLEVTTEGNAAALGEESLPGQLSMDATGNVLLTYDVEDGPEPATYTVTITGDLSGLEIEGTSDGEPLDPAKAPDLTTMDPVDLTVVIDDQGELVPDAGDLEGGFLEGLDGLGSLGQLGSSFTELGRFPGGQLSDGEVTVGDTWSEQVVIPLMVEGEEITTDIESTVTATDTLDGHEVFVIDTTTSNSEINLDLAEFLVGMFLAFLPDDATEEDRAELDELAASLRFLVSVEPSQHTMTTWFDVAAGVSRQADVEASTDMTLDVNVPDETTGEMVSLVVEMTADQDITYRLVD